MRHETVKESTFKNSPQENDDTLLRELAAAVRDEQNDDNPEQAVWLDSRWDELAQGNLDDAGQEALQALAAESEDGQKALAAFQPLDADFRTRLTRRLEEKVQEKAQPEPVQQKPVNRVRSGRSSRRRFAPAAAALVALAAAALFFIRGPQQAAFPAYELEVLGGDQATRSTTAAATERRVLSNGSRLEIIARPATALEETAEAKLFSNGDSNGGGDNWSEIAVPVDVAASGAVRVAGEIGRDLMLPPGEQTLWLVVGRPGRLPDADVIAGLGDRKTAQGEGWTALSAQVSIE